MWLVLALQAMLMLSMTILYPAFQSPDEAAHIDYVLAHRQGQWLDAPGSRPYQAGVLAAKNQVPDTQFQLHVGGKAPLTRSSRASFDALGTGPSSYPYPDQMTQHPPLYYGLAAGFTYLLPHFDSHRFDVQVFWMRLFSLLLLLPVPILIFSVSRRVTGSQTVGLLASVLPLSVPSYLRTGASVSNDSLSLLVTTVLVALVVRAAFGDLSRRVALGIGVAWGAALLTKGFALALPPAIVIGYLVGAQGRLGERVRQVWRPVLLAAAVGSVIGAWWWVRNVIEFGAVQPSGLGKLPPALVKTLTGPDTATGTELGFFRHFFGTLGLRVWGSLGLIDIPSLPHLWLQILATVLLAAVLVSLVMGLPGVRRRLSASRRLHWGSGRAAVALLPALLTILVMYGGSRPVYLNGSQLPGIQVRYVLPTVLGIALCVAVTITVLCGRLERWAPPVLLSLSMLFVGLSAYRVLDIEMSTTTPDRLQRFKDSLHYIIGWSPFPTTVSAVLLLVTALLALVVTTSFWAGAAGDPYPRRLVAAAGEREPAAVSPAAG